MVSSWGGKRKGSGAKPHRPGQSHVNISFRIPKWLASQLKSEALSHESINSAARRLVFEALQERQLKKEGENLMVRGWKVGDEGYVSCSSSPDGVALAVVTAWEGEKIVVRSDSPYMSLKRHKMSPQYLYPTAKACREHDEKLWQAWSNSLVNNSPLKEEFDKLSKS